MGAIFDFFSQIAEFIGSLINLVIQLVQGLIQLLGLIPKMVTNLTTSLGALPSFLVAFASITITVSVIFIILGRQGGGESG